MDGMKGRAMFKGNGNPHFLPGVFYDVDFCIRGGNIVVSAPSPKGRRESSYNSMSDMLLDWAFPGPENPPETEWDTPYVPDYSHYRWTAYTRRFIEAYANALRTVEKAVPQCDPLTCGNEQTYLLRARDALRSIRKSLTDVIIRPIK